MSNRFMSYFGGGGGGGSEASRFVGQLLDLGGGNKLKVKKVIAEGEAVVSSLSVLISTLT